jgi:hypothetical protein
MNDQEMIQFLMRQNEMLLGIIAGVYGSVQPAVEPIEPDNHRQRLELAEMLAKTDSSLAGGEL